MDSRVSESGGHPDCLISSVIVRATDGHAVLASVWRQALQLELSREKEAHEEELAAYRQQLGQAQGK